MTSANSKVITRFPPSPTGLLHVGSLRTMLFNYYFAKQSSGEMRFRLEDTNREKWKQEYEDNIIQSMDFFLGIRVEEPTRQSERSEVYKKYLLKLIDGGFAYVSKEEPKAEGERAEVIRTSTKKRMFRNIKLKEGKVEVVQSYLGLLSHGNGRRLQGAVEKWKTRETYSE